MSLLRDIKTTKEAIRRIELAKDYGQDSDIITFKGTIPDMLLKYCDRHGIRIYFASCNAALSSFSMRFVWN